MAGRVAMVSDCCGAPFYVMTPTPQPGGGASTAFSPALEGRCGWNELFAGNQQGAIDFYTGLFGWTLPSAMDVGELGSYQFIAHDDVMIGAIMQKPAPAPFPAWNHYFRVPHLRAAHDAVLAHGGQVTMGPHAVTDGDWIIQGIDPQGAAFALVGRE